MMIQARNLFAPLHRVATLNFFPPLGATILLLGLLNYGLYGRLSAEQAMTVMQLPYQQDFSEVTLTSWLKFKGGWQITDGQLLQDDTTVKESSIYIPFIISNETDYVAQADLDLNSEGAFSFNAQYPGLDQARHVVELAARDGQWQMMYGYYQNGRLQQQGVIPLDKPADQPLKTALSITVTPDGYALKLDDKVYVNNVPLVYRGGAFGFNTIQASARFDNLSINALNSVADSSSAQQPAEPTDTAAAAPAESTLYTSNFVGNLTDSGWKPFSGDWGFQDGQLLQQLTDGYDLGIVNDTLFSNYQLDVRFQHLQGKSAGLLFNLPTRDTKNGGHMVRYTDDGMGIFWGYFDSSGAFTGQGYAATEPPGQASHTLSIASGTDTYSIALDGQTLAQNIPLISKQGYIGLTTSQSTAAYSDVSVTNLNGIGTGPIPQAADLLANNQAVSGQWIRDQNSIQQVQADKSDYVTGLGVLAEQYVIEADITLPADLTDSGGGIIFHMPSRETLPGAYMVRFGDGGKIIFWGQYDSQGNFLGQGSAEVNIEAGVPHRLMVIVKSKTFDIHLDDKPVINDLNLTEESGWIGLISFRGPVTFSNLRLALGAST